MWLHPLHPQLLRHLSPAPTSSPAPIEHKLMIPALCHITALMLRCSIVSVYHTSIDSVYYEFDGKNDKESIFVCVRTWFVTATYGS